MQVTKLPTFKQVSGSLKRESRGDLPQEAKQSEELPRHPAPGVRQLF